MTIDEARRKVLTRRSQYMSARDLMAAILFISFRSTVRELCDVLELEKEAQELKRKTK